MVGRLTVVVEVAGTPGPGVPFETKRSKTMFVTPCRSSPGCGT